MSIHLSGSYLSDKPVNPQAGTGLSREGKAQLQGQVSELHIELAVEEEEMETWPNG